jgi:hypothetical protein
MVAAACGKDFQAPCRSSAAVPGCGTPALNVNASKLAAPAICHLPTQNCHFFRLTCRVIGVASAEHLNGRRGHEIRTSGRQNGTGFSGNGLDFGLADLPRQYGKPEEFRSYKDKQKNSGTLGELLAT